jgi:hypothetical protein
LPQAKALILCNVVQRNVSKSPLLFFSEWKRYFNCFTEKHQILTWGHKLTKSRRKAWHPCIHFVPVPFFPTTTLESRKNIPNCITMDKNYLQGAAELAGQIILQMRTITYKMRLHSGVGVINSWELGCFLK